jgi:predicted nucleic acid-binding Zn ribbon protein
MAVRHKDPCPCGSGKRYKHCCLEKDRKRNRNSYWGAFGIVAALALIALVVGARERSAARTAARPAAQLPPASASRPVPVTLPQASATATVAGGSGPVTVTSTPGGTTPVHSDNQSPLPGGVAPKPWQYDAANNRHFDPTHNHWHDGPPPASAVTATTVKTVTSKPAAKPAPSTPPGTP